MIDFTKPIRLKSEHRMIGRAYVGDRWCVVEWANDGAWPYRLDEMETYFENIPEPRKPREWFLYLHGNGERYVTRVKQDIEGPETVRVIEWPEGAPLPEWPT
jgi:hypothetical protein